MIDIRKEDLDILIVCLEDYKRNYETNGKSYTNELWKVIYVNSDTLHYIIQYNDTEILRCYKKEVFVDTIGIYTDLICAIEVSNIDISTMQNLVSIIISIYRYDNDGKYVGNKIAVMSNDILKCIL